MGRHRAKMMPNGQFSTIRLGTGQSHEVVVDVLQLDHRYHDNEGLQSPEFLIEAPGGLTYRGQLDAEGKATVVGVPSGELVVRFGPDQRDYEIIAPPKAGDYRESQSQSQTRGKVRALMTKIQPQR